MSEEIKIVIEKGIPIPSSQKGQFSGMSKILKTMNIGDSILVDELKNTCVNAISAARSAGIRVTTRKAPENKRRIWRKS